MRGGLSWIYAGMHDKKLASAIADLDLDLARKQAEMRSLIDDEEAEMRVSRMLSLSYILADLEDCLRQAVAERDYRADRRSRGGLH